MAKHAELQQQAMESHQTARRLGDRKIGTNQQLVSADCGHSVDPCDKMSAGWRAVQGC